MNNQAKIAELKKNINNKFFPEALKPKLLAQIEKLEEEDKASENKGILPHPKPKQSKTSVAKTDGMPKFVVGDIVTSLKGTNKATVIDRNMNNKNQYVYKVKNVGNGVEHEELESDLLLFEMEEVSFKPKKPTVARTVKSELKKYYAHREIKTVTVIEDGKKVVYKGEDVLNGAQFLAKGGKVEEIATYYPIRAIVEVTLDNGEKVKPANGYHIKNGAKPIAELGAALATEEIINNSIVDYHNPRFAYKDGGEIERYFAYGTSDEGWFIVDNLTGQQISPGIFNKTDWKTGEEAKSDIQKLLNGSVNYTSGSGDFDYIKFLDYVQPKVAATLLENNVTLLNDYTIVHESKEYEPVIIYKGIDGKANALSVGYFADNDPDLKLLLSIDFELHENEYHIRSKGWNIDDVDMYAKGGWVKDHKYLNKAEAYEMRYAKGKNRKGYMDKGGEVIFSDLSVELSAQSNPDFDRYSHEGSINIKPKKVKVKSIDEAISKVRNFINDNDLGGGNFTGGALYDGDKKIGRISYNGRVWDLDDNEMFAKGGQIMNLSELNDAYDSLRDEIYFENYDESTDSLNIDESELEQKIENEFQNRYGNSYLEMSKKTSEKFAKGGEVFDYKNKYSPLNITNSNDVKNFFDYLTNVEKISFHPDDKFEGNMNDSFTKKQAINLDKYMNDCFLIMDLPKNKDKDIYEIALNSQQSFAKGGPIVGRKAKGVSVKKIADIHNVTEKYLRKQLQRGQKVELEHTTDEAVAYAIAKDHIYENPDYYILLEKIEMKANGGEVKKEWVVVKPNGYYSLNASSGGGRFLPSLEMAYTYSEEEARKLAETLQKASPNVTIKAVKYGTPLEDDPYDKYAKGGLVDWQSSANSGKKVLGVYEVNAPSFKGNIQIVGFEQVDDTYYSLYQPLSDNNRVGPKEIHTLNVNSNKINNLDKGLVVIALDKNKNKVKIKRLGNRFSGDFKIGEFKEGGEVSKNAKPKRQGSQIFAKAAEIREPGEKWQEAVRRANLLLKK